MTYVPQVHKASQNLNGWIHTGNLRLDYWPLPGHANLLLISFFSEFVLSIREYSSFSSKFHILNAWIFLHSSRRGLYHALPRNFCPLLYCLSLVGLIVSRSILWLHFFLRANGFASNNLIFGLPLFYCQICGFASNFLRLICEIKFQRQIAWFRELAFCLRR